MKATNFAGEEQGLFLLPQRIETSSSRLARLVLTFIVAIMKCVAVV